MQVRRKKMWMVRKRMEREKIMVVVMVLKLVAVLILLAALLQMMYVGNHAVVENYDEETIDLVRAAFYLGGLIGVVAMTAYVLIRSLMDVGIGMCVGGLKRVRDHITGENRKQPTQPDWTQS